MPSTTRFVSTSSDIQVFDFSSDDEGDIENSQPSRTRSTANIGPRIENGKRMVTPSVQLISRTDIDAISPCTLTSPSTPRTPNGLQSLSTTSTGMQGLITSTPRNTGIYHSLTAATTPSISTNRKDITNLYKLMETQYKLDEM